MADYLGFTITVDDAGSPSVGFVAVTTIANGVTTPGEAPSGVAYGGSPAEVFKSITVDPTNHIVTATKSDGSRVIFEPGVDLTIALTT